MKCEKCKKYHVYCTSSVCIGKDTVKRVEETKDKNGNVVRNIYHETKPHTYKVYKNTYICNDCGWKYYRKSHHIKKTYSSFDEFVKDRIVIPCVIGAVLGLIVCLVLIIVSILSEFN